MAVRRIQWAGGQNGAGGTYSITLTNPTATGDLLVVCAWCKSSQSAPTISDNLGSIYATATNQVDGVTVLRRMSIFYIKNSPCGITTITLTGNSLPAGAIAIEYSGVEGTPDGISTILGSGASAIWTSNSATTSFSDLVLAFACSGGSSNINYDSTRPFMPVMHQGNATDGDDCFVCDQLNAAVAGSYAATGTCTSANNAVVVLGFKLRSVISAGPTVLQAKLTGATGPGVTSSTVNITTSAGSLILAFAAQGTNTTDTLPITDSAGQSWTQAGSYASFGASNHRSALFYVPNSAALTSVTVNFSTGGGVSQTALIVYELANAMLSGVYDSSVNATDNSGSTTPTTGSLTTSSPKDVLLMFLHAANGLTTTAGANYVIPFGLTATGFIAASQYAYAAYIQESVISSITISPSSTNSTIFAAFSATSDEASTSTQQVGVFSKDAVLAAGVFDMGIPIRYGLYDDDFVAQFSGTTVGTTATGVTSVPAGLFSKDATLVGAFDA